MRSTVERLERRWLLAFGEIDTSWSASGRVITDVGSPNATIRDLAVRGDLIYAAGDGALIRHHADGTLDDNFGDHGRVALDALNVVKESVDGSGNVYLLATDSVGATTVRKFDNIGDADLSFGVHGVATVSPEPGFVARAIDVSNNRIVIAGTVETRDVDQFILAGHARVVSLQLNGTPESGFGIDGHTDLHLGPSWGTSSAYDVVGGVRSLSSGRIVLAGWSVTFDRPGETHPRVFRRSFLASTKLSASGRWDTAYGNRGLIRQEVTGGPTLDDDRYSQDLVSGVAGVTAAIATDGSSVVAGRGLRLAVTRFDSAGQVVYSTLTDGEFPLWRPRAISMLSDGRVVIAGDPYHPFSTFSAYQGHGPALAAVSATGVIGNWVLAGDMNPATVDLADSDATQVHATATLAIASDGELLIGGGASDNSGYEIVKLKPGNAGDARPDDFPGGTRNGIVSDGTEAGLYLAYYDAAAKNLKFARRFANGLWTSAIVVDATPYAGYFVSLARDPTNNQPVIAYYDGTNADLKVARSSDGGATWSIETIDSRGLTGQYPSVAINPQGHIVVAFYRRSGGGNLRIAALGNADSWVVSTIDSDGDVGRNVSLIFPTAVSGPFMAAYFDRTHHRVKFAKAIHGGKWRIQTVHNAVGEVGSISIAAQSGYLPSIAYYDAGVAHWEFFYGESAWLGATGGLAGPYQSTEGSTNAIAFFSSSIGYFAPQVYTFNRKKQTMTLYSKSISPPRQILTGGGAYLSISAIQSSTTTAAFIESRSGNLVVRSIFGPRDDSDSG